MERLNGLDLFSGVGGNTLGLRDYIHTIAYCEADRHAQSVLLSRILDGGIEPAPIWDDIKTLRGEHFDCPVDIIVGGFPCQDISTAGNGKGLAGERSGLFFEIVRLAEEIKPSFLFLENVAAIRTRGLDTVIQELTKIGYDCRWTMLSASDIGANHKRERWFLLGYSECNGSYGTKNTGSDGEAFKLSGEKRPYSERKFKGTGGLYEDVANADSARLEGWDGRSMQERSCERPPRQGMSCQLFSEWWQVEPDVGRVVDGVPLRVDRIKRLGNAVVPLQAKTAFEYLMGIKK